MSSWKGVIIMREKMNPIIADEARRKTKEFVERHKRIRRWIRSVTLSVDEVIHGFYQVYIRYYADRRQTEITDFMEVI